MPGHSVLARAPSLEVALLGPKLIFIRYKIQCINSFWEGALFLKLPHVAVTLCCLLLLCVQVKVVSCSYEYPIGASEFFLGFICNCLSYFITARITFIIILYLQCTHMIFIIYTSCHLLCVQCGFSQGTV